MPANSTRNEAESLLPILEVVRDGTPSRLIGRDAYARLAAVADTLPRHLTTFWGFECRLGLPDPAADILFQTGNNTRGQRLLAGREPSRIDTLCERWSTWRNLRAFAALWSDPDHPFNDHTRNIWLEFDTASTSSVAEAAEGVKQPSLFFGPEAKDLNRTQLFNLVTDVLVALGETDGGYRDTLEAFIASLPDGAELFQVGLMLSRAHEGLRVCVRHLPLEHVPEWLSKLGWNGDTAAIAGLLRDTVPMLHRIALDLTLGENGVAEKLGLECYMVWLEENPEQWRPLLEFARDRQISLPEKSEALLAFPGISRFPADRCNTADGMRYPNIHRKLHHIKLNFVGGKVTEAKAYLAVAHSSVDMTSVRGEGGSGDAWNVV